ncbi:hypothetical protein [Dyadobacter sp. CY312]|uniref:hypothetical protein n=1 Tax=Dyadobacter sp. CY312 TaxID=2907303 RepID=UPI001F2135EF|nr:hypothetical protein [Dyadobacter sp. CY312]MCE7042551.1 hypothetical protein [Dyadobacter sp. CY312]
MKSFITVLVICLFSGNIFAQNAGKLMATYAYSAALPVYNRNVVGGADFESKGSSAFGMRYILKSKKAITFETGLEYARHKYVISSNLPPNIPATSREEKVELLSVPVYAHLNFLKYLFVHGGALVDVELNKKNSIDKQSGIGLGLGLGGQINIKRISFVINPFLQRHAFVSFPDDTGTRQSLLNTGVRVGLAYSL